MEQLLFSLNATIPVFLVMVIGYVLQQLHVTNDSFVKTLNSFNYKITLPVLLFKDMSTADFYSVWDTGYVLFCFFVTLFCIVITWVVTGIFYKKSSTDFLIIFSNLRKCWKGLLYQAFPAFCVSEDTPHIMAFRSLTWR